MSEISMKGSVFMLCCVGGLFLTGPAVAEEGQGEKAIVLPEVVVTAPAVIAGNEVNNLGSQVTVVTKEQISDLNAQDLPSALRRTPGVVISRHNPVGSFGGGEGGAIFIRGMGVSRPGAEVQMAIDGVPKFVSVWTHPLMDVISVDNIESIEVYKGAQPVLYGNMSFGVVDITTKRKTEEGFATSVSGSYGSYDTWVEVVEHGGKIKDFDYYLVQSYRTSDGHRENSDGELQNYFGRVGYKFFEHWDATLTFNHTDNYADDPGPRDGSELPDGRFSSKDYFTVATISNQYAWGKGHLKLYMEDGGIDWVDQDGVKGKDTLTDYRNYGVRARQTLWPWAGGEVIVGMDVDYIQGEVNINDPTATDAHFPEETFRMIAPYVAVDQLIGSRQGWYMIPSAGVRYIDHNSFDSEAGPQAGLVLGYRDTEMHASYARGINYPGVFVKAQDQLFFPGNNRWDELNPEIVDHYEAGISHRFGKRGQVGLTFFYDDGKDRIVISPPPPPPAVFTNIGEFRTRGVEGSASFAATRQVTVFAGFTYLDADPEDLPYAPEWTGSFGTNYRFLEKFQINVDGLYVDEQYVTSRARRKGTVNVDEVGSYFLLNAKLTYDFSLPYGNLKCQAYVAGENLTDTDYEQKKGYPMPGISAMTGITVRF
jgi:iron complex outermembrane receptor protein